VPKLQFGAGLLASCMALASAAVCAQPADRVLRGGTIYSMDPVATQYSAVALRGEEIVWLGDREAAARWIDADTEVVELEGRVVFPGFIDTHIHTMDTLPLLHGVMLSPSQTADEVLAAIAAHAEAHPEQNPVLGSGFLARAFGIDGPTAEELDRVVPDRPALMIDEGGHTAWANSLALAAAGIDASTPDPVPGAHYFQRDEDGHPTGWLVEGAAIDPVSEALGLVSEPALAAAAPEFFRKMSAVGLTAAFDAGMIDTAEAGRAIAHDLAVRGQMPLRLKASLYVNRPADLDTALSRLMVLRDRYQHEYFDVTTLKLSLDGTVEAKTAVTIEPYLRPEGHVATPLMPTESVASVVIEAMGLGIDLHLHAIGDGAVRNALDAIEAGRKAHPESDSRAAICHIEVVNPADIPRFAALDVVGQTTPTWFEYDNVALEFLGRERFMQLYPLASIRRHGARVTLGSDYPVTWIGEDALNPMFNIEMAVTRQRAGDSEYPIQPKLAERLSVDQAIRAHTSDAAWQLRLEDQIGTLEVGKQADLVVLDRDPYRTPLSEIHSILVDQTYSDGRLVYSRP
jgi:predicted amidohydrolase YtcJ